MQQTLVSLTNALDEKADSKTIEKMSETLTMIQSTTRKEQETRANSEKQITMIKQAMTMLFHRTERKEKEVRVQREVRETHHLRVSYNKESTKKLVAAAKSMEKVE